MFTVVGLGNPGEEYENTRHNTGRMAVEAFCGAFGLPDFEKDKKANSLKIDGKIGKNKVMCLLPETFMNKSGNAIKKIITSKKKAEKLVVVHDDIDIALGKFKMSFGKGHGGHNGVKSIMRAVGTKEFFRIRVGICPTTPGGKLKKPKGGEKVLDFLMGKFKPAEIKILKKVFKEANQEIEDIVSGNICVE